MKRIIAFFAIVLTAAVLITLSACGNKNKSGIPSVENGTVNSEELETYIGEAFRTQLTSLVRFRLTNDSTAKYDLDSIELTVLSKDDETCEFNASVGVEGKEKPREFKCTAKYGENGWALESMK